MSAKERAKAALNKAVALAHRADSRAREGAWRAAARLMLRAHRALGYRGDHFTLPHDEGCSYAEAAYLTESAAFGPAREEFAESRGIE